MFWLLDPHQEFAHRHHPAVSLWGRGLPSHPFRHLTRTRGDLLTCPLQPVLDDTYILEKVNEIR